MKKIKYILFLLIFMSALFAQQDKANAQIQKNTNIQWLLNYSETAKQIFEAEYQNAVARANAEGLMVKGETPEGNYVELQKFENNRPVYFITHNLDAAKTVSTNNVWSGGSAGLSLDGSGVFIGEWDGGIALPTHQEYSSRINIMEASGTVNYHSTHVAGTIIAGGVVSNAKGMAYNGELDSYDWNSDISEMSAAAANGMLLSNHSYGTIRGWYYNYFGDNRYVWFGDPDISQTEDYKFGFYSSQAQTWDQIAYNAPYYLIVKSAGNDRNDDGPSSGQHWVWDNGWTLSSTNRDPDGEWDCIGEKGSAKNILTVGAVNDIPSGYSAPSDVTMSSFSSWGPVDDGRVKPDIVANGVSLYSTYDQNNSSYASLSGTSMSSPSATGSLALLQQHYNNSTSLNMRASTLKALVVHTADEAGPDDGPDYMFGWGLLNTESAADIITKDQLDDNVIREIELTNGSTFSVPFTHYGSDPITATIAWTDPAGPVIAPALDPSTPALVNDLDIRITRLSDNAVFYPWKLDPNNPSSAATTGDNLVDNVEKIFIESTPAGSYVLEVSHKGSLSNSSQYFSLIFEGQTGGPGIATNPNPADGAIGINIEGNIASWTLPGGVTSMQIYFDSNQSLVNSNDPTVQIYDGTAITSQSLSAVEPLLHGTEYFWRIVTSDVSGSSYSDVWSFTTEDPAISTIFFDDFENGAVYWNITNDGGTCIWEVLEASFPNSYTLPATSTGKILAADSDECGSGSSLLSTATLTTPIDATYYQSVELIFDNDFRQFNSSASYVEVSIDGGGSWSTVWSRSADERNTTETIDISSIAGQQQFLVRFRSVQENWDWWWVIDNVRINVYNPLPGGWSADFGVADAGGTEVSGSMTFGMHPAATNGLDPALGEEELSPVPASGTFDARFGIIGTNGSTVDLRNESESQINWIVKFQPGSSGYPFTFTWNENDLPAGSFYLRNPSTTGVLADMKTQNSYQLTDNSLDSLFIEYNESLSQSVSMDSLWNLVSVPLQNSDMSFASLYPDATTSAFAFGGSGYVQSDSAEIGKGYWLKFDQTYNYLIQGSRLADPVQVDSGWNIIGPFDEEVAVSQIVSNPTGIVTTSYFGYQNAYVTVSTLSPGKAYWVKTNQSGTLDLTAAAKLNFTNQFAVESTNKIIITDAAGRESQLYLLDEENTSDIYSLPPKPPAGIFDVRFASDKRAEFLSNSKNIIVSGADYPISIKAEGATFRVSDGYGGSMIDQVIGAGEEVLVNNRSINVFTVAASEIEQVSLTYDLQQNYPNPFNPSTLLKYSIPEAGYVELKVFNSLGELVNTLVSQNHEAGSYQVEWNGTNQYGQKVVSGVYFYSIKAGDFHSVKKMMLLK